MDFFAYSRCADFYSFAKRPAWDGLGNSHHSIHDATPMSAKSGNSRYVLLAPKAERPPRGGLSEIGFSILDQTAAALLRFLRQPNRPSAPRPVAKSGSAPGSGVSPPWEVGQPKLPGRQNVAPTVPVAPVALS